nr:MAG TPA: hypothetical protein [Caudoviricetes sp.]
MNSLLMPKYLLRLLPISVQLYFYQTIIILFLMKIQLKLLKKEILE